MQRHALLGRYVPLEVMQLTADGARLGSHDDPSIAPVPLARNELPEGVSVGEVFDVFVYLDVNDRPAATRARPAITLGEVAFVDVTRAQRDGAEVDAAMPLPLFIPPHELTGELRAGERHAIGLVIDDTGRLAGTQRVRELMIHPPALRAGEWVEGEAWRDEPGIGLFVIVDRCWVGLVPSFEPHRLYRGERARFRVASVLPDGKVNLSLRGLKVDELDSDADAILEALSRPDAPRVGDRSDPEEIRAVFGLSKKAFKRAVGTLLKRRAVTIDAQGFVTPLRPGRR